MKKSLNAFVLLAVLATSMPVTSYSQDSSKFADMQEEEVSMEMPAEAIAESEALIAQNQTDMIAVDEKGNEIEGPSCIKNGVAVARDEKMNKEQRKELFVHGTITDCDGQIWKIKIIPGSNVSKQMTIKSWKYAKGKTGELFKIETYKKAIKDGKRSSKASWNFTKHSSKLLKKGIWDYAIVDGIYESLIIDTKNDWVQGAVTVSKLRGTFGFIFGAIYAGLLKPITLTGVNVIKAAYHVTKGTIVLVGGIAGTAGGIVATVSSPVIVPAVEVLTRPLLAIGSIATTGSIIPGAIYVWNGSAWVTSQLSNVPDREVRIGGVRFVRLTNPKAPEKKKYEITSEDFETIVGSSVVNTDNETKQAELEKEQNEIRKDIRDLQNKSDEIENRQSDLNRETRNNPVNQALEDLYRKTYGAETSVDDEVKAVVLDDEKLREIVVKYAESKGITLTEEEIEKAIAKIKKQIQVKSDAQA